MIYFLYDSCSHLICNPCNGCLHCVERGVVAGLIRPTKKVKIGTSVLTPTGSDLDCLNEVIMKAQGKPFKKGETEPITDLVVAMFHTLIEQVCSSISASSTIIIGYDDQAL